MKKNVSRGRGNGFLDTDGRRIVNEAGEEILLMGWGLGNWLLCEGYMWLANSIPRFDRPRRIESVIEELTGKAYAEKFWKRFREAVKKASWSYYEPRTLHDSSLSLSTHSVLACDIGDVELGYQMFRKACGIDLSNENPHSSDAGIHAASCGGLWQCVVYGFGGVRMLGGKLRISPKLPEAWSALRYTILWQGQKLRVTAKHGALEIHNETNTAPVTLEVHGKEYSFIDNLTVYF